MSKCNTVLNFIKDNIKNKSLHNFIENNCLEYLFQNRFETQNSTKEFHFVIPNEDNLNKMSNKEMGSKVRYIKKHIFKKMAKGETTYSIDGKGENIKIMARQGKGPYKDAFDTVRDKESTKDGIKIAIYKDKTDYSSGNKYGSIIDDTSGGYYDSDDNSSMGGDDYGAITGGKPNNTNRQDFFIRVGRIMQDRFKDIRISMLFKLLDSNYHSRQEPGPKKMWLNQCVSLYNWLYTYEPMTLQVILPITDLHPGVTLAIILLDPSSPVTNTMLQNWNFGSAYGNSYQEWNDYLKLASSTMEETLPEVKNITTMLNKMKIDSSIPSGVIKFYRDYPYNKVYPDDTIKTFFSGPDGFYRKIWQDQVRCLVSCSLNQGCNTFVVEDNETMKRSLMDLRAHSSDYSNNILVTESFGDSNALHYGFLQWLSSTDFMYLPTHLNSSAVLYSATHVHNKPHYFRPNHILNNYNIRAKMVEDMNSHQSSNFMMDYMNKKYPQNDTASMDIQEITAPVTDNNTLYKLNPYNPV